MSHTHQFTKDVMSCICWVILVLCAGSPLGPLPALASEKSDCTAVEREGYALFLSNRPWKTADSTTIDDRRYQLYRVDDGFTSEPEPILLLEGWYQGWFDTDPNRSRVVVAGVEDAYMMGFDAEVMALIDLEPPYPIYEGDGERVKVLLDVRYPGRNVVTYVKVLGFDVPATFSSIWHPVFDPTPGSNRIAFAAKRVITLLGQPLESVGNVWMADLDTGEVWQVAGDWGTVAVDPSFTPDGDLLYIREVRNDPTQAELWRTDPDDPLDKVLLRPSTGRAIGDPAMSPDGAWIAFEQLDKLLWNVLGRWSAIVMAVDGSTEYVVQSSSDDPTNEDVTGRITTVPVWLDDYTLLAYGREWDSSLREWSDWRIRRFDATVENGPYERFDLGAGESYQDQLVVPY